jgi:drug/metabolite transporter (DMT)-like permease
MVFDTSRRGELQKMNSVKSQRTKAVIFLIITAILWSLGGVLIKQINWNPLAIAGTRSAIASILILIVIRKPKINGSLPQIGSAVAYAATVILFVVSTKMTTAANAILLQYTAPIYSAIFGVWFLKEKTKLLDWITICIVFGGMTLFFMDDLSTGGTMGNILAAISGVSFAFTAIFMRMQKDGSPLNSVLLGNLLTFFICLPFMLKPVTDIKSWAALIVLGFVQLGLAYILYSFAIKHVTALEALLIPVLEPILNPVWVFLVIGELPGIWSIIGGIIVLIAVTLRCVLSILKKNDSIPE